ncbi:MAG: 50S ribosomal protein L24 [Thermodesulfobacteriota bacterium]
MQADKKKFKIKKDDQVMVVAGREQGKTGKVSLVNTAKNTVLVEKLNMVKRHTKPTQAQSQGGIIEKEAPINISNVMYLCGKCVKPVKIGMKILEGKNKVRFCRGCGEVID